MQEYTLRLKPNKGLEKEIKLHIENRPPMDAGPDDFVYSDMIYEIEIPGLDITMVDGVNVYINDEEVETAFNRGDIFFVSGSGGMRRIFDDYFGYVTISLILSMTDGEKLQLYSDFIAVMIRKEGRSSGITAMLDYVLEHQSDLLLDQEDINSEIAETRAASESGMAARLHFAEEICIHYEACFAYFSSNSRFETSRDYSVDNIEKLQQIDPATLQYMATHPEYLRPGISGSGINVNGRYYFPEKTMIPVQRYSRDIYENRVITGFLSNVMEDVEDLLDRTRELKQGLSYNCEQDGRYIHSASYIQLRMGSSLDSKIENIESLLKRLVNLRNMYGKIMTAPVHRLNALPVPTAVFTSVMQYRRIYDLIYRWFGYDRYDLRAESFMTTTVNTSRLYELYVLCRLMEDIKGRGYVQVSAEKFQYETGNNADYENTGCMNIFRYRQASDEGEESAELVLYYQPVIFNFDCSDKNGLGIFRNMSYGFKAEGNGGKYYTPDYVIKETGSDGSVYHILDAKFSTVNSVTQNQIAAQCFKYLVSISPVDGAKDRIGGLSIIYGKCRPDEKVESIYDYAGGGNMIMPYARLVPMAENVYRSKV